MSASARPEERAAPCFVAVSELAVPEAGREALEAAFSECFAAYMRSEDHRQSHRWISNGERRPRPRRPRPRPRRFRRYEVIAE